MDIDKLNRLEKHCEDTLKMRVSQNIKDEHAFTLELIHGFKSLQSELTKVKEDRDSSQCCGSCGNFNNSSNGYICDLGCIEDCTVSDICDNWEGNK